MGKVNVQGYQSSSPSGVSLESIKRMEREVQVSVENGLSGAVVSFGDSAGVRYERSFGSRQKYQGMDALDIPKAMTNDTMFDLASLTKVFSTNLALHLLVDRGYINIDDPAYKYIAGFSCSDKRGITLRSLLSHDSGFDSVRTLHKELHSGYELLDLSGRDQCVRWIADIPRTSKVTKYTCANFLVLGLIIEAVTGQRQDQFVEGEIFKPLGLNRTLYNPLIAASCDNEYAATERCGNTRDGVTWFPGIRTHTLSGEVHDEITYYLMNGVSGSAGLFSNVADLGVLCRLLLNEGQVDGFRLCSPEVIRMFRKPHSNSREYGLGWQMACAGNRGLYGTIPTSTLPVGSVVGHTGWTGTCVVLDFMRNSYFLLLTNKKHSPMISCSESHGLFEGDLTVAGRYRNIIDHYYHGLVSSTPA